MRTPETIAINDQLQIVRLQNTKFQAPNGYWLLDGYALHHPSLGYVSFDGETPFQPGGGKATLQSVMDLGGFVSFEGMYLVKSLQ
ncbi:3-isopropylmalate dehydratase [Paenibacillus polymyxa]|uniref:3-isopropylmalate dehydratase n=1 Tax=Paenibacillus polymyxa TaxID=1406 RepID=UPI0025B67F97|nr:3-isopropylmalate dehydratase [Paenibacillus polymyxa]MDN4090905.1 3-isopropylmalate dehydratase [Paenibacillus polymyxa]